MLFRTKVMPCAWHMPLPFQNISVVRNGVALGFIAGSQAISLVVPAFPVCLIDEQQLSTSTYKVPMRLIVYHHFIGCLQSALLLATFIFGAYFV